MLMVVISRGHRDMHDKTKTPIIGITAKTLPNDLVEWGPTAVGIFHTYIEAVIAGGGVPMILPLSLDDDVIGLLVESCDGFLFTGGDDIDPTKYNEKNLHAGAVDPVRDTFELKLLTQIEHTNKPVLGICRGMQMLNVARGGTLYQDIPLQRPNSLDHSYTKKVQDYTILSHDVLIDSGTLLKTILETDSIGANSQHHQAVKELGTNLVASAYAEDGVTEAIEDPRKPFVVGVQCHPETLFATTEHRWLALFEQFVAACRGHYDHEISSVVQVLPEELALEPQTTASAVQA